jgi:hypothetical protein
VLPLWAVLPVLPLVLPPVPPELLPELKLFKF